MSYEVSTAKDRCIATSNAGRPTSQAGKGLSRIEVRSRDLHGMRRILRNPAKLNAKDRVLTYCIREFGTIKH